MSFSAPSWDLFIGIFLIICVGYGFLVRRERIVVTLAAAYIAIIGTQVAWPTVLGFFHGEQPLLGKYFISFSSANETQVQIGLFTMLLYLVTTRAGLDGEPAKGWFGPFEILILSILTGTLIGATVLNYLPIEARSAIAQESRAVFYLTQPYLFWVLAPIFAVIFLRFHQKN